MRTIIDILHKGNQELFHSKIIAWLLDPEAEHGLNSKFLEEFADILSTKGIPELKDAILDKKPSVKTETTSYRSRYDIEIKVNGLLFVLENKTKSIGEMPQFKKYSNSSAFLIALGFSDVSFLPEVTSSYPLITYEDILEILNRIGIKEDNDFSVFIKHYKTYLSRELSILDYILTCYRDNEINSHNKINEIISSVDCYTSNDFRFLNLYYLEKLKEYFSKQSYLKNSKWVSDKNMVSGVWLANYKKLPDDYFFSDAIRKLYNDKKAGLWFHVEMWNGVVSNELKDVAGMIQLRCSCECENKEFINEFKKIYELKDGEYYPARTDNRWDTFYIVAKNIVKKQLVFSEINTLFKSFMSNFSNTK